jgi:RNA polymerase sigma factor (sigma-70 family)
MVKRCLTPAQQSLAESHMRLAQSRGRRYSNVVPCLSEDVMSVAYLGLVIAAAGFDPSRGAKFSSYAVPVIDGTIKDFLKHEVPVGYRDGKSLRSKGFPGTYRLTHDRHDEKQPWPGQEIESRDAFERLVKLAPKRCKTMLRHVFAEGIAFLESAELQGIGQSTMGNRMAEAKRCLRKVVQR